MEKKKKTPKHRLKNKISRFCEKKKKSLSHKLNLLSLLLLEFII